MIRCPFRFLSRLRRGSRRRWPDRRGSATGRATRFKPHLARCRFSGQLHSILSLAEAIRVAWRRQRRRAGRASARRRRASGIRSGAGLRRPGAALLRRRGQAARGGIGAGAGTAAAAARLRRQRRAARGRNRCRSCGSPPRSTRSGRRGGGCVRSQWPKASDRERHHLCARGPASRAFLVAIAE